MGHGARQRDRTRGARGAARHARPRRRRRAREGARESALARRAAARARWHRAGGGRRRALRRHPAGGSSQHLRAAARAIAPALREGTPVIACAKGIERGTHRFMTEVIAEAAPTALPAILSGPGFAADVARGLPAAVTLVAGEEAGAAALPRPLGNAIPLSLELP